MDFKSVIGYMANHFVLVSGTTLALTFTAAMVLLIRSIGEKSESKSAGGPVEIDVDSIEGAMRRVLASQPVSIIAAGDGAARAGAEGALTSDAVALQSAITERETKIEQLKKELEQAKFATSEAAPAGGGDGDAKSKLKIEELQARLAEYEIIEDDIADLSMYKEENARLKDELDKLKAHSDAVAEAVSASAVSASTPGSEVKFEKTERFELDPNDDVMKEFAAAVEVQRAPAGGIAASAASPAPKLDEPSPSALDAQATVDAMMNEAKAGASPSAAASEDPMAQVTDAAKLLSEVESLPGDGGAEGDVLAEIMDTDKLLAEVDSLKGESA